MKRDFWQERYESGETRWDHGAPSPPLTEYLAKNRIGGRWLVPGCGSGHDVRALAAAGAEVVGMDFAPGAITTARSHRVVSGECYELADFLQLPPRFHGVFDGLFEHTCFCAIDPSDRPAYVNSCSLALRPGGTLLAVFYLEPRDAEEDGQPPFRTAEGEIAQRFGGDFLECERWWPSVAYPGREGRELVVRFVRR